MTACKVDFDKVRKIPGRDKVKYLPSFVVFGSMGAVKGDAVVGFHPDEIEQLL